MQQNEKNKKYYLLACELLSLGQEEKSGKKKRE
jgi:hypothetical protein